MSSRLAAIALLLAVPPALVAADDGAAARYREMLAKNPAEGIALDRLWKAYQERGATGELLAQYERDATFPGRMIHGLLLRRAGRDGEARKCFQDAAALEPTSAQPFLAMADVLQSTPAAAAVALDAAARLQPSPDTLLKLGSAWLAAGERDKAADAWERAVALNPGDLALRRQIAQGCEANGLREKALPHFGFVAEHGDPAERAQALQDVARVQEALGKNDDAIDALDRALRLVAPGNWMRRGIEARMIRLHERAGKLDGLEARWKKQAAENPRDLAPCVQLADLYEHLADAAQCRVWLEKAAALDPKDAATRLRLARILAELNELDGAGKIYDGLLRQQPGDSDALFARCEIFIQQDRPREARERIEQRLAQSPGDEALRARAVDFCTRHRLFDVVERQLRAQAAGDEAGALALANFYFDQRRNREAVETLGTLVKSGATPAEQAAALGRAADALRGRGDSDAALAHLSRAVALAPASAPLQSQLGGLLASLGRTDDAQAAFEAAWRAEPSEANDRKIFDLLASAQTDEPGQPKPRGAPSGGRAREYALRLSKALTDSAEKKPGDMLRVARWLFWTGESGLACAMCEQVCAADENSMEARELFIKAALAKGDRNAAIARLRELARLQPARETELRRRMAGLELDIGQTDEALAILREVSRKNPGDPDVLLDMARALQRADRWYDALAELERAFAIAPPDRRPEIARALVATCDRLQLHDKAAEFLLRAIDAEPPGESRKRMLDDLMARADRPATTRWLLGEFGKRHALRPDDYATSEALAEIYKRNGEEDAAFALLREAAESAPDEAAGLRAVVREAAERGDLDTALALQRRVAFIGRNCGAPDETVALAELQEGAPDADGAAATWRTLARRFPRDPRTLMAAADFFLRWDFRDDARGLLRSVRALDPLNLDALAKLARVTDSDAEAISCREQILRSSDAEAASDPLVFPGLPGWARERMRVELTDVMRERAELLDAASAQALRGFWTEPGAGVSAARELRLDSIRDIAARLRASGDRAALRAWVARWQAADGRSEPLWAFYHAGAGAETLGHVAKLMAADPADGRLASAFAWLGLRLGEFRRVGAWAADERSGPPERDAFLVALAQFLDAGPAPENFAASLFPRDVAGRSLLAESAAILATRGSLRGAVELGTRAFAATRTEPAGVGLALARWQAELGDAGSAQRVLRRSIDGGGGSYDQPLYAAMRAYWLLLGPEERESFLDEMDAASATAQPVHAALTGALLGALNGNEDDAEDSLDALLGLRAAAVQPGESFSEPASGRFWNHVLATGMQLKQWGFDRLAAHLWERVLEDEAAIRLDGAEALAAAREMRFRLSAQEIEEAGPAEEEGQVADFVDENDAGVSATLASVLDAEGFPVKAARVHAALVARDPKNFRSLAGLLVAAQKTRAAGFALDVVTARLFAPDAAPPPPLQRELAMQAAQVLRRGGNLERAADVLERAAGRRADDVALQSALADLRVAQGRLADAEKICREMLASQPRDTGAVLALGRVLEAREKTGDAIALYESLRTAETEDRLAAVCLRAGFASKALALAHRIVRVQPGRALALAAELERNGRRPDALRLLQAALQISRNETERFGLAERIVGLLGRDDARTGRHLARLRVLAGDSPELLARCFSVAAANAADARGFLEREWNVGAGPLAAGIELAALLAKEDGPKRAPDALVKAVLARTDLGLRDAGRLHAALAGGPGMEQAACAVSARFVALAPDNDALLVAHARDLHNAGREDEAVAALDMLRLRTAFHPGLAPTLARAYADCGRDAAAGDLYEEAMKADPLARDGATWLAAADLLTRQGRLAVARRVLRGAYANETALNMEPLVRWVAAQRGLDAIDAETDAFQLTRAQRRELPRALFEHHAAENDAERALAVAADDVAVIFDAPDFPARLREFATAGRSHEKAARIFETALRQPGGMARRITGEAAALYADWAETELAALPDSPAAQQRLQRACELKPDDLAIARRLVRLLADRHQPDAAKAVLQRFLSATQNEREAREAREMLASLR